jgi:hypothetical protein
MSNVNNTAIAFDTLQYAKKLQKAGFTNQQAEVQAEAIKELIDDKLATKSDFDNMEERLSNRINEMGYKLTMRLGSMLVAGFVLLGAFLALVKFVA